MVLIFIELYHAQRFVRFKSGSYLVFAVAIASCWAACHDVMIECERVLLVKNVVSYELLEEIYILADSHVVSSALKSKLPLAHNS